MSDTPRTDVLQGYLLHEDTYTCWQQTEKLCRELERENAALRDALHDIMTESDEQVIWRMARAALDGKEKP